MQYETGKDMLRIVCWDHEMVYEVPYSRIQRDGEGYVVVIKLSDDGIHMDDWNATFPEQTARETEETAAEGWKEFFEDRDINPDYLQEGF